MTNVRTFWIHPATFTYRIDPPGKILETLWSSRAGWGYLKRRDSWKQRDCTLEELHGEDFEFLKPQDDPSVRICTHCGLYMTDIPGALASKHISQCKGGGDDWQAIEDAIIHDIRVRQYEGKIAAQRLKEIQEQEEAEKRERFDRIREDAQAKQLAKDRKKRLRQETKEELRNR